MKPTIESLMQQYNIRPYNGSWYVQESKLKEVLQKIVDQVYDAGQDDGEAITLLRNGLGDFD